LSRSTRHVAARLAALVFAALLAAPGASAAQGDRAPVPAAAAASAPTVVTPSKHTPKVTRRGRIDPIVEAAKARSPRKQSALPRLHAPQASAVAPRVGARVRAATRASSIPTNLPIAQTPVVPGLTFGVSGLTQVIPADAWVAVGPDHVVETVNLAVRMKRRQNEATVADLATSRFFGLPDPPIVGSLNSDARVIYDSFHARWVASEVSMDCQPDAITHPAPRAAFGHGYIDFAISDSADPTQPWTTYYLTFNDALPDYPGLGTSTDKVSFASNIFPLTNASCAIGNLLGVEIDVVDWAKLTTKVLTGDVRGVGHENGVDPGPDLFTPRVAVQTPATSTTLFGVVEMGPSHHVGYFTITGGATANTITRPDPADVTTGAPNIPAFANPPDVHQPGTVNPVLTGALDDRPTDAIWQNDRLVFVSTTGCVTAPDPGPTMRDCVRVSELNTATTTPTTNQDFLLGEAGRDYYHGGIGLSLNGSLHVAYSASSTTANDFISGYAVYQRATDARNSVSPPETLLAGVAEYNPSGGAPTPADERWGDYLGVAQDPQQPGAVWAVSEAASANNGWMTNVVRLDTDTGSTYVPIAPTRLLDTRINLGVNGRFTSNVARAIPITGTIPNFGGPSPIPANAVAITGNVTPVNQTSAGFISVTPRPVNNPSTSTDNFPFGDIRANNVTVTLGPNGAIAATYAGAPAGSSTHLVFDVTGYFVPDATNAMYHPVTPGRLLDSRPGAGNVGGYTTPFSHAVPRSFPVWNQAGIPSTATAVTGNLTVVNQTGPGFAAIGPAGVAHPATSNLNFNLGDVRANGVTVKLGSSGELWVVFNSDPAAKADVVFDVTGYYAPASEPNGLKFFPLSPGRIMDTRPPSVLSGLQGAQAGTTTTAKATRPLNTAGHQGAPLAASAVTGNFTVVSPTKPGFISILKAGTDALTSTLNFPVGDIRANGITVPLNGAGDMLLLYASGGGGTVHMVLDITGYFR
jgi:hypothetical protein